MPIDPLVAAFERQLRRSPGATAVAAPGRRATLGEIDALARAAARRLSRPEAAAPGPVPGEPVGLQSTNGPGFLASLLALRRAGLPALLLDPGTPAKERRRIADEVGARWALVCGTGWPAEPDDWHLDLLDPSLPHPAVPADTGVIKMSSGSTGSARGIATPTEALLADDEALVAAMGIRDDDRLLSTIPFSHSYGLSSLAVPALVRGLLLVLPTGSGPFAPLAAAAAAQATVFPTVPAYLGALVRLAEPPPLPASLRLLVAAGAPLPAETSVRLRQRFGLPVHVFYGASECGGICYDRDGGAAERGTVGAPVAGVEVEVEPLPDAEPASPGEPAGRVVVRSPAVATAYLPADARLGAGRYVTEDLARWRDGELELVGRLNDLINVKGKKVNPKEVERVLAALAAVEDVLVTGAPGCDRRHQVVRAVIACRPGTLSAEEVLAWCRDHLADHKVPRSVVLVEELPRTDRGKVDRAALARLAARQGLDPAAPEDRAPGA